MTRGGRIVRHLLRLLALLAAGTLVTALAVLWLALALSRGWERDRLRGLLEQLADRQLAMHGVDGRLRIGALKGPLLPTLSLHEVTLDVGGESVASAGRIGLRLDLRRLWRSRTLVLERVTLERVALTLRRDPGQGWPWSSWRPGPPPRALALEVRSLVVSDAELALDLTQAGEPVHLAGPLEAEAAGLVIPREGDPAWPSLARAHWRVGPTRVAGRMLRSAELAGVLHGSRLSLSPVTLDAEFGRARLELTADLAGWLERGLPAALSLDGEAEGLDLGVLLARPALAGALAGHLTARVERPAEAPLRDARVELAATVGASRVGALRVEGAELRGRLVDGRFELSRAVVDSSFGRLRASGRGSVERADALDIDLEVRDLQGMAALAGRPDLLAGQATLAARLAGPWDALQGEASLAASQLRVGGTRLGTLEARLRAGAGGRLVLAPLRLTGGDWPVLAEGPVTLRRIGRGIRFEAARLRGPDGASLALSGGVDLDGARRLGLELRGLPVDLVAARLGSREPVGGRLDATLALDGAWPRPEVEARFDWQSPRVAEAHADRLEGRLASEGGVLRGEARLEAGGRPLAVARLATPWDAGFAPARLLERPQTRLTAAAHGFDLAFLAGLLPSSVSHPHGRADLALELVGAAPRPRLSGDLVLAEAGFELPSLGQRLGPLAGHLTLKDDTLRVESLRLAGGAEGEALLSGRIGLAELAPASAELELALQRFPFQYGGRLRADLDGRIRLEGPADALVARGELVLGKARYFLTSQRTPVTAEISVRNDPAQPASAAAGPLLQNAPGLYQRSRVDVQLEIPRGARVVGEGAEVRVRGLLHARKAPLRDLALEGSVQTLGGIYRIRGKSFEVQPGRVIFTGRTDFDPDLDLRATRRVRDVEVIALLRGRGSNPKIRLESEPPYPEDDLLALLLFGRTRQELGRAESAAFQSFLAEAAGGAALQELRTLTGLPLPLDVFEVRTAEEAGVPTLGLGAHVTRDVFVHFGRSFGETAGSQVGLDWRFAPPHWSVETRSSTDHGSSADLVWTYDY